MKMLEVQVPQSTPALEAVVERSGDPVRTNITFADPLTTDRPSGSMIHTFCIMLLYQYLLHYGLLLHIISQYLWLLSLILQGLP